MPDDPSGFAGWIFGYGSLVDVERLSAYLGRALTTPDHYFFCSLSGWRRVWNVAMDNSPDAADGNGKHYLWRTSGERPSLCVTFLNLEVTAGAAPPVNGIAFRATAADIAKLDAREARYRRVRLHSPLEPQLPGAVFIYLGRRTAVARYEAARQCGQAVVSRDYLRVVEDAFRSLGHAAWERYLRSTDRPQVPVADLVQIGGAGGAGA